MEEKPLPLSLRSHKIAERPGVPWRKNTQFVHRPGMKLPISSVQSVGAIFRMCQAPNDVTLRTLRAHHVNQVNVVPRWKPPSARRRWNSPFVLPSSRRARKIRSGTPYSRWLMASLPHFAILPTTQRTRELTRRTGRVAPFPLRNFVGRTFSRVSRSIADRNV